LILLFLVSKVSRRHSFKDSWESLSKEELERGM
jgi:hypothetical protein